MTFPSSSKFSTQPRVFIGLLPQGWLAPEEISQVIAKGLTHCGFMGSPAAPPKPRHVLTFSPCSPHQSQTLTAFSVPLFKGIQILGTGLQQTVALANQDWIHTLNSLLRKTPELGSSQPAIAVRERSPTTRCLLSDGQRLAPFEHDAIKDAFNSSRLLDSVSCSHHLFSSASLISVPCWGFETNTGLFSGAIHHGALNLENCSPALPWNQWNSVEQRFGLARVAVDSLEAIHPDFIVSCGLTLGLEPPFGSTIQRELGLVVVANNAVAHDLIAARILCEPEFLSEFVQRRLPYLPWAQERGWGPRTLQQIYIESTHPDAIEMLQTKTKLWSLNQDWDELSKGNVATRLSQASKGQLNFSHWHTGSTADAPLNAMIRYFQTHLQGSLPEQDETTSTGFMKRLLPRRSAWPQLTLCRANFSWEETPTSRLVLIGPTAVASIQKISGTLSPFAQGIRSLPLFSWKDMGCLRISPKKGKPYFVFWIRSPEASPLKTALLFFLASGLRWRPRREDLSLRTQSTPLAQQHQRPSSKRLLTPSLAARWFRWSFRPSSRHTREELAKENSVITSRLLGRNRNWAFDVERLTHFFESLRT